VRYCQRAPQIDCTTAVRLRGLRKVLVALAAPHLVWDGGNRIFSGRSASCKDELVTRE
jgi:hypothetical protein